ncbi:MAG: tetratricopeptide repeat protein [Leptolyngbya sp. SIO4C1]|nr:tetratricopeptide repeat protein [Leptolyngbya sp. SIO4C1]
MFLIMRLRTSLIGLAFTLGLLLSATLGLPATAVEPASPAPETAPFFDDLGNHHFQISTESETAQRYFNQGLILAYGFNHAEAARSFKAAAEQDATCAMCYWGLAYVQGPNINAPMDAAAIPTAWEASRQAAALSRHATIKERLLIQALTARYSPAETADRTALDAAYADAMQQVHERYPNDADIAVLYAEALMDTMPWAYWDEAGQPKPETVALLNTLESVIARQPDHPGALHLYIHAVEKEHPELAIEAADQLRGLVPDSGHLVHMPSHIYIRVGRYHDAVAVNQDAVAVDQAYLAGMPVPSLYTAAYVPHNHHFAWFGALMTGQKDIATAAAQATGSVAPEMMRNPDFAGALQHYYSVPLYTQVRFEQWDEILATPRPEADLLYPTGVWHYARGRAFTGQGKLAQAQQELAAVQALAAEPELAEMTIWGFNSTADILQIAAAVLAGELAAAQGDYERAVAQLQTAVEREDRLVYTEPPDWYSSTRNLLGNVLLQAGRDRDAEQAFRDDLSVYPNNGWSLYGLMQSLQAQGRTDEAAEVRSQFEEAWQYADIQLAAQ